MTTWPLETSSFTKDVPMKPPPPVTRILSVCVMLAPEGQVLTQPVDANINAATRFSFDTGKHEKKLRIKRIP